MLYLTDTHSLIWFLTKDSNLSDKAKAIFLLAENRQAVILIPTIVLAELLFVCEKKKFQKGFSEFIEVIKNAQNFVLYNLDLEIIIECERLIRINEMHDRIIVATAKILNAVVITKDANIKESGDVKIVW